MVGHTAIAIQTLITVTIVIGTSWLSGHSNTGSSVENKVNRRVQEMEALHREKVDRLYRHAEFGRLSSGMFHDIMTPLSALIGTIDNFERCKGKNLPEVKEYLSKAVTSSRHMGDMMATIRRQVRVDEPPSLFSIKDEINAALATLRYRINQTKTMIICTDTGVGMLYGNAAKFHHIIINLIANAIDACEGRNGIIHINLNCQNTTATIHIKDNGCGIPEAMQKKIFDFFVTSKDSVRGMGIGLSCTKHAIEQSFGGTITFTSTEHIGTTFFITLPLKQSS